MRDGGKREITKNTKWVDNSNKDCYFKLIICEYI
jgi:hypothetical protein